MNAVDRGVELLHVKGRDLPPLAKEFLGHLVREGGSACLEVFLTAFAVYAQCVEGLPCDDDLYQARPQDIAWFSARTAEAETP